MTQEAIDRIEEQIAGLARENRDLRARVERLEGKKRVKWPILAAMILLLAAGPMVVGAQKQGIPRSIEAETFVLRDRGGRVKGLWETNPEGMPKFSLYDNQGISRTEFLFRNDGTPALKFLDPNAKERLVLGIEAKGVAAMGIFTGRAMERISVGTDDKGHMAFAFLGGSLKPFLTIDIDPAGNARIRAWANDGKLAFELPTKTDPSNQPVVLPPNSDEQKAENPKPEIEKGIK